MPSTVCAGASSVLEAGAYLDAVLVVQGPSSSTPILQDEETGEGGGGTNASGLKYGMSGGSAKGTLVMSEWVNTDDYGWTKVRFGSDGPLVPPPLCVWDSGKGYMCDYLCRVGQSAIHCVPVR